MHALLNRADLPAHLIHSSLNLSKERVKLVLLVGDYFFQEDLVLLDNGLVVGEVLLLDQMVNDTALLSAKCVQELLDLLGMLQSRRCSLIEHHGELVDATVLLARFVNLGLDDAVGDCCSDRIQHVRKTFDASRVLVEQSPRELKLRLFRLGRISLTSSFRILTHSLRI